MWIASLLLLAGPVALPQDGVDAAPSPVTVETAGIASRLVGLEMTDEELAAGRYRSPHS